MIASRWKCSHCDRLYTTQEYLALPAVKAVPDEAEPMGPRGYGYLPICACSKVFHRDKWRIQENVVGLDGNTYWVSTVHLELNHGFFGTELWYETMVKDLEGDCFLNYQDRYTTQAEAEAGHLLAVEKVRSGLFKAEETKETP